jgi:phenylalanyl-tRNA synthetase beta chain
MAVMRTSLLGGLVESLVANRNRGEENVRIFEIGRCFEGSAADASVQPERIAALAYGSRVPEQWAERAMPVDLFDLKGDLEALVGRGALELVPFAHPALHPGQSAEIRLDRRGIGILGALHPRLQQKYELPLATVVFEVLTAPVLEGSFPRVSAVSKMPSVRRDLAVTVPENVPAGAILARIRAHLPPGVREIEVFDLYRGKGVEPGRKSLAFRIVMQDTDRTLTDSDAEAAVASIRKELETSFKAEPRT